MVKVRAVVEGVAALAKEGATSVYVEIWRKNGPRVIRHSLDAVIIERVDDVGSANR